MDAIVSSALEEICSAGLGGLTLTSLWSGLSLSVSRPLTPFVKQSIWTNLLAVPPLQFINKSSNKAVETSTVQSLEYAEKIGLVIVANESLLDSFLGIYDLKTREGFKGFNADMRNSMSCRGNGITQSQLAKEFGKGGNKIFYTLKSLECQGLITRRDAVVRTTQVSDGDVYNRVAVTTNMVYLSRYAKNLGSQQRIEINQEKRTRCDGSESGTNDEYLSKDVSIKDFLPAMKAICDKLGEADDKDLFVQDIKQALGYRLGRAHKVWKTVLQRLKDADLVKEYSVIIDNKTYSRLKLLREFSEKYFKTKYLKCDAEDLDVKQAIHNYGVVSEQLVELSIENQIYYMIDSSGSKGITLVELCERLGINNKRYYNTFINMFHRCEMPCREEGHKKGMTYRVWTSRNLNTDSLNALSSKLDDSAPGINANMRSPDSASQYDMAIPISESWSPTSNALLPIVADREHVVEYDGPSNSSTEVGYLNRKNPGENESMTSGKGDVDQQKKIIVSDFVPSENFLQHTLNTSKVQPHHKDTALTAKREQRICERLQEDKFIIKHELHKWLEGLEKEKHSSMDRRTLDRLLQKLQDQGLCKCWKVSVPFSSNCRRQGTKDVVSHPSVQRTPEIAAQILEKIRLHERECRRGAVKLKDDLAVPVLDGVHTVPKRIITDEKIGKSEIMQANGFILSKMIRAKLLHIFLWKHLSEALEWNDILPWRKPGHELNYPRRTCKLFVMDDAIKAMPVELFYQVAGSTYKIEETTRSCMCLKDLPVQEYKNLSDSLTMKRLSGVFDILRRLTLIQLVTEDEDQEGGQFLLHSKSKYAFEQYPYIEEPRPTFSSTSNHASCDPRLLTRHNFELQSGENVDDYWKTLEDLYSTADETAAAHAFPGSSVQEVCNMHQTFPHTKPLACNFTGTVVIPCIATDDPNIKLSVKDCEKIAKDLDLTVQQVLAYKNKRNQNSSTSRKRKRYSKAKERDVHMRIMDERVDHEAFTDKCNSDSQFVEDEHSFAAHNEDEGINSMTYLEGQQSEEIHKPPIIGEDKHHPFVNQSFYSIPRIRFSWTRKAERHLVIQYARLRAELGPGIHRAEWTSLDNLSAPPEACKRGMARLKRNLEFRISLMKLINILSKRYAKYLKKSKQLTGGNHKTVVRDLKILDLLEQDDDIEEKWDDFDCKDIKTALDEALQHTQVFKLQRGPEGPRSNKKRRRKNFSRKPSRARIPGKLVKAMSKLGRGSKQAYESLAVSNAVELYKLVLLSTSTATEVPNIVATLRRYSQHDLFAAFSYLREKKILIGGTGRTSYELSQQFLQRFSASPFPDTGERVSKFANWIHEKESVLIGEGTDLIPDLECGDIFVLLSLVATGELSMIPCLPDDGVGEPEDSRILKRQADDAEHLNECKTKRPKWSSIVDIDITSRREKGFPGIKVSLNRTVFSSASAIGISPGRMNCKEEDKYHVEGEESECNSISSDKLEEVVRSHNTCVLPDCNTSPWEAMTEYAACLTSKSSDEETGKGAFHPEVFKDIYQAVKNAGDQGLALNGNLEFIDKQGNSLGGKMAKIAIEVLHAFGLTMQVNAYDCVHVVDSLYRSKYLLTSVASSSREMQQPSKYQVSSDGKDLVRHKDQDAPTETGIENNYAHRVTIHDLPADVPSSLFENPCIQDGTLVYPCSDSSGSYFPILPWMNGDGMVNKTIYKGLVRCLFGSVMQNPGMLEDDIIRRMDVLNPQSCRKLMELLILENHLIVRKMRQARSCQPPSILGCLLKKNLNNRQSDYVVWREHFFANPASCHLL
ncbi:hypothetical protein QQ045_008894 [Rhodiola kirilowii]